MPLAEYRHRRQALDERLQALERQRQQLEAQVDQHQAVTQVMASIDPLRDSVSRSNGVLPRRPSLSAASWLNCSLTASLSPMATSRSAT
jgi:hypothetical protein